MRNLLILFVVSGLAFAGGPIDDLKTLSRDVAYGYFDPLVEALTYSFSTGLYHSAKTHMPLGFDIGVNFTIFKIPDEMKYFSPTVLVYERAGDSIVTRDTTLERVPTVFGPDEPVELPQDTERTYSPPVLPGGLNISYLPFIVPQVNMGLPGKVEVSLRYAARKINGNKFSLWGAGLKAGLNRGPLKYVPVNIAFHWMIQGLKGGDIFEMNTNSFSLIVSKGFLVASLFAGVTYTVSDAKASYTYTYERPLPQGGTETVEETLDFKFERKSFAKGVIGIKGGPPFLKFIGSYEFGKRQVYRLGVIFSLL